MASKILTYRQAADRIFYHNHTGQQTIVKTGCFDILHIGHIQMFARCKEVAPILVILLGSDQLIHQLKQRKPQFDCNNRAFALEHIDLVDYIVILNEADHTKALSILKPHYYHIPSDEKYFEQKKQMTDQLGIKLIQQPNTKIYNFGTQFEPHSSILKV